MEKQDYPNTQEKIFNRCFFLLKDGLTPTTYMGVFQLNSIFKNRDPNKAKFQQPGRHPCELACWLSHPGVQSRAF